MNDFFGQRPKPQPIVEKPITEVRLIPKVSLEELDTAEELATTYNTLKNMLAMVEYDEATPLNQKAQLINSLAGVLGTIMKLKAELYSMQQVATIEEALGNTLKEFPDIREAFLARYEGQLKL